jgi:Ca2+-binding EF-hand superfamily protein
MLKSSSDIQINVIKRGMIILIAVRLLSETKYADYSKIFKILDSKADGYLDIEEA